MSISFRERATSIDHSVAAPNTRDEHFWDALDAKDVYFSDDPTCELEMAQKVPAAFKNAGYKNSHLGKADTHPVWILRARRKSAPRFAEDAQFVRLVIEVLRSAGVRAPKADVTITRDGDTIHVSFLWPLTVRAWRFDENSGLGNRLRKRAVPWLCPQPAIDGSPSVFVPN